MKKFWLILAFTLVLLSGACTFPFSSGTSSTPAATGTEGSGQATPSTRVASAWPIPTKRPTTTPRPTSSPQPTKTPRPTKTSPPPTPTSTPIYPAEGYGPIQFPADVNPLTGWQLKNPGVLERRPVIVKVENLPRADRPQWGLSSADIVYEYYTELGTTRFAAIYYGQDAAQVGPVRSARLFDIGLIRMYRGMFLFGGAYEMILQRLFGAEFAGRLLLESAAACPPLCRLDGGGANHLFADTSAVNAYASAHGIDNSRQLLNGTVFQAQTPDQGKIAEKIYTRFSGSIYNRWDYDPKSNRYERFVDQQDDVNRNNEVYGRLIDRANNNPIAADNLVILLAPYSYVVKTSESEILDVSFTGDGAAFLFRDGKSYLGLWKRPAVDALPFLVREDGTPLPFKPGSTWYEVMGVTSKLDIRNETWKFVFSIP